VNSPSSNQEAIFTQRKSRPGTGLGRGCAGDVVDTG